MPIGEVCHLFFAIQSAGLDGKTVRITVSCRRIPASLYVRAYDCQSEDRDHERGCPLPCRHAGLCRKLWEWERWDPGYVPRRRKPEMPEERFRRLAASPGKAGTHRVKLLGGLFQLFLAEAPRLIHEHGNKVQILLRNCHQDRERGSAANLDYTTRNDAISKASRVEDSGCPISCWAGARESVPVSRRGALPRVSGRTGRSEACRSRMPTGCTC